MHDLVSFIGLIMIGAALAVPLVYGLTTLLGLTHKQFRPVFRPKQQDGTTAPLMNGQAQPSVEQHEKTREQPRRKQW